MEIIFWPPSGENSPIRDFIASIESQKDKKRIINVLDLFEEQGLNLLKTNYLDKVKPHDLFEIKIRCSTVTYRILLTIRNGSAELKHAFKKKSRKIPQKEISIALSRG